MRAALLALLIWACAAMACAHEVRPAFLKIDETAPNTFSVSWKQPILSGKVLKLEPQFPENCTAAAPPRKTRTGSTVTENWQINCPLEAGEITIDGLARTLTDVFVQITYLEREPVSALLKPASPTLTLGEAQASPAREYLRIGVEHIIFGWDHLLFVIGLTLLVSRRQIWGVATAFTLAHSLTLAGVALLGWSLPSRPVEILIAASIVLLALEVAYKFRGRETLAGRRPYLISFIIGLIHGFGFAGALAEIGLPKGTELLALLLFNLGVELGQFAVIALAVIALFTLAKIGPKPKRAAEWATTYAIAGMAMFWVFERLGGYWV